MAGAFPLSFSSNHQPTAEWIAEPRMSAVERNYGSMP
jgi:hypothetical protein